MLKKQRTIVKAGFPMTFGTVTVGDHSRATVIIVVKGVKLTVCRILGNLQ